jgi:DNA repair exonuclease SbcCD ATPase subunit
LETAARLREQLIQALATLKEQHEDIVRGLREAEAAHEIQRNRDDKLEQKSRVATAIGECRAEILRWIGQRAVQVVSRRLSQVVFDFVDEAGLKGRIPSPYNEEFVRELLGSGVCVCNRPLNAGSAEWAAVANLLKSASNAELLGKVVRARARSQMLRDDGGNAPKLLHATQTKLAQLLTDQAHLEQQIAELGKRIESLDIKEIADRERARRAIEARLDKEQQELGGVRAHIATLEREKQQQEAQLEELLRKNKKTIKLLKKRQLVAKAIEILKRQLEGYEQDARARIQTDINDILESVAHKDFRCRFNDNFSIELILNERATAKSAGENQLLSLAFIASLVQFAAQRIDATDLILKPGTIAPLVLDAPLGQLDPRYQASVAEFLPKLARQVVLLVSGSQGGENVLKSLEPYVAAEYLLVQENREPRGKKQILRRTIRGKLRDLILFGQDRTMTRIDRLV